MYETTINKYETGKKMYLTGNSIEFISKELNISSSRFSLWLKTEGVDVSMCPQKKRINNDIFQIIDTEEKAYWLGFLYADGYIGLTDNRIELTLQLADIRHIEKFKEFLQSECKVSSNSYRSRLSVKNKKIKNDLIKLGCVPQKSLILTYPTYNQVPQPLMKHFIRGYFDGDGCLCVTDKTKCIDILGTYDFLYQLCIESNLDTSKIYVSKSKSNKVYRIVLGSKLDLYTFSNYVYEGANVYLDRKYDKYKKLMKCYV